MKEPGQAGQGLVQHVVVVVFKYSSSSSRGFAALRIADDDDDFRLCWADFLADFQSFERNNLWIFVTVVIYD